LEKVSYLFDLITLNLSLGGWLYIELGQDIVQGENAVTSALTHLETTLTQESD
jgi:hypothetical protein